MKLTGLLAGLAGLACSAGGPAAAYDGLVEKQTFELESMITAGGETIAPVRIGWESYGELNQARDNAIVITHFFSGTSHAAGKYSPEDSRAGYWDQFIGSGKLIDTDKYFVISADTLVNLNTGDPTVVTTGPASANPKTGKPYGLAFPVVTIRDFVNVQRALIESLGIEKLHAVIGASMGAFQALEWASAYPKMVERVIPIVGAGESDASLIGWLNVWAEPIRLDPNWNGGDYYGSQPPVAGLTAAMKTVTLHAMFWEATDSQFGRKPAAEGQDPAHELKNAYAVETYLDEMARVRASKADANHFLYLVKANQGFMTGYGRSLAEGLARIEAPVLLIGAKDDLIFFPRHVQRTRDLIAADGTPAQYTEIDGPLGHLDGIFSLDQVAEEIAAFLD
jgi:homoserine O-acetyltransferase